MNERIMALAWDFGGVLLRTEDQAPRREWERQLNLQPGELHDLVFKGEASRRATIGEASTEDIWRSIGEQLSIDDEQLAQLRSDFWAGDRLDHGLIELTRSLRQHIKTGLLSNAWPDLRPYLQDDLRVGDAFDVLVISAEAGTAKPGAEIYALLIERLGVDAGQCIFIDDSVENVQAALEFGIPSIHFQERGQALRELARLLPAQLAQLVRAQ